MINCHICERTTENEQTAEYNGWRLRCIVSRGGRVQPVCDRCYRGETYYCEHDGCDNRMLVQVSVSVDGSIWCPYCADSWATLCDNCGDAHEGDNMVHSDNHVYCESCHDDMAPRTLLGYCDGFTFAPLTERKGAIVEYIHNPQPGNYRNRTRFYGVELEVECNRYSREETARKLHDAHAHNNNTQLFILKTDASLDNGIEVVTQPCTLELHQKAYPWKRVCVNLRNSGCKSHDTRTCGIHVHASKCNITELESVKIDAFVHSQVQLLARLGRRNYGNYCQEKKTALEKKPRKGFYNTDGMRNRYWAVNWSNDDTIEFRFPKGSLVPETIVATVELIDAIIAFCSTHGASFITRHLECRNAFVEYIKSDDYPALSVYAKERGL